MPREILEIAKTSAERDFIELACWDSLGGGFNPDKTKEAGADRVERVSPAGANPGWNEWRLFQGSTLLAAHRWAESGSENDLIKRSKAAGFAVCRYCDGPANEASGYCSAHAPKPLLGRQPQRVIDLAAIAEKYGKTIHE